MQYNVIVIGGGTSGAIAGIAAGRMGLNTLIVESNGFLGGTATGALVAPIMSTLCNDYISDINEEIRKRLMETGDGQGNWFNPEMLKLILEQLALEAGVHMKFYSQLSGVKVNNNKIEEIHIQSKSGYETLKGDIIIDATGDGDVAALSDVPFESGNKEGINQPVSLRFQMANVEVQKFSDYVKALGQTEELDINAFHTAHTEDGNWPLKKVFQEAVSSGLLLEDDARYFQCFSIAGRTNEIGFNCPEIFEQIDGTDSQELTKAQIIGKQKIYRYVKFMKTLPGFENAYLSLIAPMVGVRETRRIKGALTLTGRDILSYRKFESRVISSNYPVDIHNMSEEDKKIIDGIRENVSVEEKFYDIPVEIMFTKEIHNLIVTGRCASADFIAQSAIRIQSVVRAMGEAAAYIAYLALEKECNVKNYDINSFNILLKEKGFK